MTNKTSQLDKLFAQNNQDIEQVLQSRLLSKNKIKVKVKSLSKTAVLTLVALIGSVIFSISFAWLLTSF